MLPAGRGILPRTLPWIAADEDVDVTERPKRASGKMPDAAGRMPALPALSKCPACLSCFSRHAILPG